MIANDVILDDGVGRSTDRMAYTPINYGSSQFGYGGPPYQLGLASANFSAPKATDTTPSIPLNGATLPTLEQANAAQAATTPAGPTTNFSAVLSAIASLLGGGSASAAQQNVGAPVAVQSSGGSSSGGLVVIVLVLAGVGYYGYSHGWFGGST